MRPEIKSLLLLLHEWRKKKPEVDSKEMAVQASNNQANKTKFMSPAQRRALLKKKTENVETDMTLLNS